MTDLSCIQVSLGGSESGQGPAGLLLLGYIASVVSTALAVALVPRHILIS